MNHRLPGLPSWQAGSSNVPIVRAAHLTDNFVSGFAPAFSPEVAVDKFVDYKKHYYANHRGFFILFALFVPVDIVDTLLKGIPHFLEQGLRYDISTTLQFTGLTIAAITRNERYHQFFAIYFLAHTVVVISFAIFHTLV